MNSWIKWNGGVGGFRGPVRDDDLVETKLRDGTIMKPYPGEGLIWTHYGQSTDIVEYRIVGNVNV
ncbi:hypothetical protein EVB97_092 [Rhizobium phage RHph_Y65]|uniref:Uncharacterized protein n=1 Tax=Rhizobium phage RHph_Y65 TaxID=2509785 RepID=A0A7S5R7Q8_9CAUD|nr:hypothetical protein PQC17_gp092 [Rhizobium phage RHph_Y65]QIG72650.1 hypothetical protein EVB97_092 [Rhizobium phage RHph_Y65]